MGLLSHQKKNKEKNILHIDEGWLFSVMSETQKLPI